MVYLIAYNINERLYDYSDLKEYIKSLGQYQHPMDDVWFVKARNLDIGQEVRALRSYMHSDSDTIFFMSILKESDVHGWMPKAFWQWFNTEDND